MLQFSLKDEITIIQYFLNTITLITNNNIVFDFYKDISITYDIYNMINVDIFLGLIYKIRIIHFTHLYNIREYISTTKIINDIDNMNICINNIELILHELLHKQLLFDKELCNYLKLHKVFIDNILFICNILDINYHIKYKI